MLTIDLRRAGRPVNRLKACAYDGLARAKAASAPRGFPASVPKSGMFGTDHSAGRDCATWRVAIHEVDSASAAASGFGADVVKKPVALSSGFRA